VKPKKTVSVDGRIKTSLIEMLRLGSIRALEMEKH
jgi:hypothetical protein